MDQTHKTRDGNGTRQPERDGCYCPMTLSQDKRAEWQRWDVYNRRMLDRIASTEEHLNHQTPAEAEALAYERVRLHIARQTGGDK
jgi:hypothetical protein